MRAKSLIKIQDFEMAESGIAGSTVPRDLQALMGLSGVIQAAPGNAGGYGTGSARAPDLDEDVSVAGVMLLSAMSVGMAIMAMVMLALIVIGAWWLVSHIPVPAFVSHAWASLHLF